MYLWGDDCTSFSLSPADTLTEAKAALIAAGISDPPVIDDRIGRVMRERGLRFPEAVEFLSRGLRSAEIVNLAAVRAARKAERA